MSTLKHRTRPAIGQAPAVPAPAPAPLPRGATPLPGGGAFITLAPNGQPAITLREANGLRAMGGSDVPEFNAVLLSTTMQTMYSPAAPNLPEGTIAPDGPQQRAAAASAALAAFKPADAIEGMLAAQAVALHNGAMECLRRAMVKGQPVEVAARLRKDGANLARAMVEMVDGLDRKRGKGPQVVRVERVTVHEGGQAIVGNVQTGNAGGSGQ